MRIVLFFVLTFQFIVNSLLFSQENYFYTGKNYGSESLYNPIYLILNGSYDIIQLEGNSRQIFKFPYALGSRNVFDNLRHPINSISHFGWKKFLSQETFPLVFVKKGGQWLPNYQLHLIGGGMTYSRMKEWYAFHNFPYPKLFSITTLAAYHYLNEVVENENYKGETVDPIADIYLFDIGGIVLFSFDNINRFFKEKLNLSDWSLQPSISLDDLSLQNNGQYFSIKWKLPYVDKWSFFYYFGMTSMFGLSYKYDDGSSISSGFGLRARNRYVIDANSNQMTINLNWNFGVFYDLNNSLLTSLTFNDHIDNMVNLNIYPGLFRISNFSPGIWATYKKDKKVLFGISTIYGIGISL